MQMSINMGKDGHSVLKRRVGETLLNDFFAFTPFGLRKKIGSDP